MVGVSPGTKHSGSFQAGYDPRRYVPQKMRDRLSVAQLARDKSPRAIAVLAEIMEDEKENSAVRVKACEALMNRGFGTPATTVQMALHAHHGDGQSPSSMSLSDLRAAVALALTRDLDQSNVIATQETDEAPPSDFETQ